MENQEQIKHITASKWQEELIDAISSDDDTATAVFVYRAESLVALVSEDFEYDTSAHIQNTAFLVCDRALTAEEKQILGNELLAAASPR
jgi:hypothetical protein